MKGTISRQYINDQHSECIWMQAGVVREKRCRYDYECASCHYDKAMVRIADHNRKLRKQGRMLKGRGSGIVFWKEKMQERPPGQRPCLHSMKGKIQYRNCINDYRCGNCDFDQYFVDRHLVHAVIEPVEVLDVHGFKIPQGYYLHRGHAWVKVEEGAEVRIGLDDFSLRLLGPPDEIKAPLMGKAVSHGDKSICLRRGKNKAALVSPVSGVVTAVNMEMLSGEKKDRISPYTDGWVMTVHADNVRDSLKSLMIGTEAESFLAAEIDALYQVVEEEYGPLTADGGQLGNDIYGNLPESSWDRLVRQFLDR
ncbi:MAG: glycine cleavage system protein H [Pseudomonadota bacterium]